MTTLLWSLKEAALQFGGVSTRTIRRMIDDGQLSSIKVRSLVMVVPPSIETLLDSSAAIKTNNLKAKKWHTNAKTLRTGGSLSQTQAAKKLDARLGRLTGKKPKH